MISMGRNYIKDTQKFLRIQTIRTSNYSYQLLHSYFLSTHHAQPTNIHMAMADQATISPEGGGGPTRFIMCIIRKKTINDQKAVFLTGLAD
jgi:hypothetical protein